MEAINWSHTQLFWKWVIGPANRVQHAEDWACFFFDGYLPITLAMWAFIVLKKSMTHIWLKRTIQSKPSIIFNLTRKVHIHFTINVENSCGLLKLWHNKTVTVRCPLNQMWEDFKKPSTKVIVTAILKIRQVATYKLQWLKFFILLIRPHHKDSCCRGPGLHKESHISAFSPCQCHPFLNSFWVCVSYDAGLKIANFHQRVLSLSAIKSQVGA